jgi:ent-copalyl diphosphate synthase
MDCLEQDKGKEAEEMKQWIEEIREMMRSMTDGEISTSPYDTAWVSLVPALDGSGGPQFPKSLQWIIDNQFSDGSWGDRGYFSYYDRICNTLACVIALKTWKTGPAAVEKGIVFLTARGHSVDHHRFSLALQIEAKFWHPRSIS